MASGASPGGPMRRRPGIRIIGKTPPATSVLTPEDGDEDDVGHRQRRRRESILAQNSSGASPVGSPVRSNRRQSRGISLAQRPLTNMTLTQLSEHYTNCIKLSTENKINAKNAFALHLIDYMSDMLVDKGHQPLYNFQVASCSLDASSKIYANRVDIIHKETRSIASELSRTNNQQRGKGGDEEDGDGEDQENAGTDCRTKPKKRRKKSQNIASDPKTLMNDKVDLQFEVDPLFHKTTELFAKGGGCGVFLTQLFSEDDGHRMVLNSTIKEEAKPLLAKSTVDLKSLNLSIIDDLRICKAFVNFKFENWSPGEQQQHNFSITESPRHNQLDDHDVGGDDFGGGDVSADDFDGGDAVQNGVSARADGDLNFNSETDITGNNLTSILSTVPSEYSYFKEDRLSAWAGPNHWKVLPKSRLGTDTTTRDGKMARVRTKKATFFVDFDKEVEFADLFKKNKMATQLTPHAIGKWSEEANTLPEDHHFEIKQLITLILLPSMVLQQQKKNQDKSKPVAGENVEDYNYQNPNDVDNYCPAVDQGNGSDYDDGDNESNSPDGDHGAADNGEAVCFTGDNLLAPPRKVARFEMPHLTSAKRINVKQLKKSMWNYMSVNEDAAADETMSRTTVNERIAIRTIVGYKSFTELYRNLPTLISAEMTKDLSPAIAFFCLLDLANEKGLRLKGKADLKDVSIQMAEGI